MHQRHIKVHASIRYNARTNIYIATWYCEFECMHPHNWIGQASLESHSAANESASLSFWVQILKWATYVKLVKERWCPVFPAAILCDEKDDWRLQLRVLLSQNDMLQFCRYVIILEVICDSCYSIYLVMIFIYVQFMVKLKQVGNYLVHYNNKPPVKLLYP